MSAARAQSTGATPSRSAVVETLGAAAGMVLFALLIHHRDAWLLLSFAGMGLTAWMIDRALRSTPPLALFGLRLTPRSAWLSPAAALFGVALGIAYRDHAGATRWPATFTSFAAIAALIGSVEELLYRGYLYTRLAPRGAIAAALVTATLHAIYKCALFAPGLAPQSVDLPFLAAATIVVGTAFGALRAAGGSVFPPLVAHAAFDIIVYGDATQAPWWVWS